MHMFVSKHAWPLMVSKVRVRPTEKPDSPVSRPGFLLVGSVNFWLSGFVDFWLSGCPNFWDFPCYGFHDFGISRFLEFRISRFGEIWMYGEGPQQPTLKMARCWPGLAELGPNLAEFGLFRATRGLRPIGGRISLRTSGCNTNPGIM